MKYKIISHAIVLYTIIGLEIIKKCAYTSGLMLILLRDINMDYNTISSITVPSKN